MPELSLPHGIFSAVACSAELEAAGTPAEAAARLGLEWPAALDRAVIARQYEFLAGRLAARRALALAGEVAGEGVRSGPGRAPGWPAGFVGSIAHSRGLAWGVAAGRHGFRGLGIDLEHHLDPAAAREIASRVLDDEEVDRLDGVAGDRAVAITLGFSAKEALYKCLQPLLGVEFDFPDLAVTAIIPERGRLRLALRVPLATHFGPGREFDVAYAADAASVRTLAWIATAGDGVASAA